MGTQAMPLSRAGVYKPEPRTLGLSAAASMLFLVMLSGSPHMPFSPGLGYTAFKNSNFEKGNQTRSEITTGSMNF